MHDLLETVDRTYRVLILVIEACGAAVIAAGALWAIGRFLLDAVHRRDITACTTIRVKLGRFLTLGLEFLLAADILTTVVTPSFAEIGKLAAIAAIRTALNYFLGKEIAAQQRQAAVQVQAPSS